MAQQTAVDWLFEQIPVEWSSSKSAFDAYQQAKQMQFDQMQDSFNCGVFSVVKDEDEKYSDLPEHKGVDPDFIEFFNQFL
jgi:hypothetical protein